MTYWAVVVLPNSQLNRELCSPNIAIYAPFMNRKDAEKWAKKHILGFDYQIVRTYDPNQGA